MAHAPPVVLDTITDLRSEHRGRVVVAASHGGLLCAGYAARAGVRAVVLHDAGVGRERAGLAGVDALGERGVPAAAAEGASCRIGDGADLLARGRVCHANAPAEALGVRAGQPVGRAAALLGAASIPAAVAIRLVPPMRRETPGGTLLLDTLSLLGAADGGRRVVSGSHGALLAGRATDALPCCPALLVLNDAGLSADRAGVARLAALEEAGVAAVAVSHWTARIGDAASSLATGVVSCANGPARASGLREGDALSGRGW